MKDEVYLEVFLAPIRVCAKYRPKFGNHRKANGYSFEEFRQLYGSDLFYSCLGLDSKFMYSAHKAAGGMTSIYRQIGIGCERLFRAILVDVCQYENPASATWSYTTKTRAGNNKKLHLDGRLLTEAIRNETVRSNVITWISDYCAKLGVTNVPPNGVVFEVRQGYKSKDSKRQNADIDNATVAWASGYLPVFAIFSAQIDADVILRYQNSKCGTLIGISEADRLISLFSFFREVLLYDLEAFFRNNQTLISAEVNSILNLLLNAE